MTCPGSTAEPPPRGSRPKASVFPVPPSISTFRPPERPRAVAETLGASPACSTLGRVKGAGVSRLAWSFTGHVSSGRPWGPGDREGTLCWGSSPRCRLGRLCTCPGCDGTSLAPRWRAVVRASPLPFRPAGHARGTQLWRRLSQLGWGHVEAWAHWPRPASRPHPALGRGCCRSFTHEWVGCGQRGAVAVGTSTPGG